MPINGHIWTLLACLSILLTGCTPDKAYHLKDPEPAPDVIEGTTHPVVAAPHQKTVPAPVVTVEFDEQGKLFACGVEWDCQIKRAIKFIEDARRLRGQKHLVVLAYVHGWHHNASDDSENFRNFHVMINCLNQGQSAQPHNHRGGQPVLCSGLQADANNLYVGIYIGWRGESIEPWLTPAVTALSVANRHDAAARLAANSGRDGVEQLVLRLSFAAKHGNEPSRFILVGHSFGGLIVGRIAEDLYLRRLHAQEAVAAGAPPEACLGQFADLVVLLNPADSSIRLANLAVALKEERPCGDVSLNPALSHPLLLSVHTSSDSATDGLGKKALTLAGYDRDFAAAVAPQWDDRPDKDNPVDTKTLDGLVHPVLVEDLRRDTVNYAPYLRNLCYLDQANGQDPICSGLNDTVHKLREQAWKSVMGSQVPNRLNPNYSLDPFYHGAYELLTAVCYEPWEARGKAKNKKHEFDPDFLSPPCTDATLAQRLDLRDQFEHRLEPYLAFPIPRGPVGDVLFDVYVRAYSGCYRTFVVRDDEHQQPPSDCSATPGWNDPFLEVGAAPWNNTAVWQLNTSYEIVQAHSGFWNADAASLLIAIASQFKTVPYDSAYDTLPALPATPSAPRTAAASPPSGKQRSVQQQRRR